MSVKGTQDDLINFAVVPKYTERRRDMPLRVDVVVQFRIEQFSFTKRWLLEGWRLFTRYTWIVRRLLSKVVLRPVHALIMR
jgi:hypothetical protein